MEKHNKNRTNQKIRYIKFDNQEQMNKFIIMYKDMFIPYSDYTDRVKLAKKQNDILLYNQFKEGYSIEDTLIDHLLRIQISIENWNYIVKYLNLKEHSFRYEYCKCMKIWSLE